MFVSYAMSMLYTLFCLVAAIVYNLQEFEIMSEQTRMASFFCIDAIIIVFICFKMASFG
jgi:hypothetical protein